MTKIQKVYRELRIAGISQGDARYAAVKLVAIAEKRGA